MRIIDISERITDGMSVYEGDPPVKMQPWTSIDVDGFSVTRMEMGTHTGTHIDAPVHYYKDGKRADELDLEAFFGECEVTREPLKSDCKRIITLEKCEMDAQTAKKLIEKGMKLIGTSLLSIGGDEVHRILLAGGCAILENLRLEGIEPEKYFLASAPLKISADGSPVRACLIEGIKETI